MDLRAETVSLSSNGQQNKKIFTHEEVGNTRRYRRWFERNFVSTEQRLLETRELVERLYSEADIELLEIMGLREEDFALIGQPARQFIIQNPNVGQTLTNSQNNETTNRQ